MWLSPARLRSLVITLLDLAAILAGSAALVIVLGGRTRAEVAAMTVRLEGALNPTLIMAAVLALRLAVARGAPPLPALPRAGREALEAERARFAHAPRRPRGYAIYASIAILASLVWLGPQLLHPRGIPDPGDPLFSAWRLASFTHQLVTNPAHLFDGNIYYPAPRTLAYSDATVLQAMVAAPWLLLGADPLVVANLLLVIAFPLNALAFFHAGWRLTGDLRVALIMGIAGSIDPFHAEHYSHFELQYTFFIPLAIVAALDLMAAPSIARGARLGVLVALQWLACMYFGLMLLTFLVPFAIVAGLAWRTPLRAALWQSLSVAGVTIALVFGTLAIPYVRSEGDRDVRSLALAGVFSAAPSDYSRQDVRVGGYRWRSRAGNRPERAIFPGTAVLATAAAGLVPPLPVASIATLVATALAFDWSLGPYGLTYDDLYHWLRPFRGLRVPARFAVFVHTGLIVIGAFGCRRLFEGADRVRLGGLAAALLALAYVMDLRFVLRLEDYPSHVPGIYRAVTPDMVLAEFPWDRPAEYMYFSTRHWARLLNGYSGSYPRAFLETQNKLESFPSDQSVAAAHAAGATHLTFNCAFERRNGRCERTIAILDGNAALELIATDRWQQAEVRLYRYR